MAFSFGFFDGKSTGSSYDRLYSSGQISELFDGVIVDGVYLCREGGLLTVTKTANTNRGLTVSSGKAWFRGTWTINSDNLYLTVSNPSPEDRTDAVVLEINRTDRINYIKIVENVANADDLIHNENVDQFALAYITVDHDSDKIHDYDIYNVVGSSETPYFAWIMQDLTVSDVVDKWSGILGRTVMEFTTWYILMQEMLDPEHENDRYDVLLSVIERTANLPYISRILPRVSEYIYNFVGTGSQRTFTIDADILSISNVRVNGNKVPYSISENSFTFLDAPEESASITARAVPNIDIFTLYFEEPE